MNLISRIVSYFFGTLKLKMSGEYCERMLNIFAANSISFWNPIIKKGDIYITVLKKDIKKIRILRRNTDVKISIINRSGFPLVFNKYKYRYGLMVGVILFIVALNILQNRMWNVKVIGGQTVTERQIIDFLENNDVKYGKLVKNIDTDILKQKLMLSFNNVAWASLNKQGSVLEVNITEFVNSQDIDAPYNIVADCDGIIKHLEVSMGSTNVRIGDTVFKNQVLVSGIINYGAGNNFVKPNGKIIAEIKENAIIKVKKTQKNTVYTGKSKNKFSIEIMGVKIPLNFKKEKMSHEVVETEKKLKLFGGEIPIVVKKQNYLYVFEEYYEIDENNAKELARKSLLKELDEKNADNIVLSFIKTELSEGEYIIEYELCCTRDIGQKKLLEFE